MYSENELQCFGLDAVWVGKSTKLSEAVYTDTTCKEAMVENRLCHPLNGQEL